MSDLAFTPPAQGAEGILILDRIKDFDASMLAACPPGIVGVFTAEGRHFSVVTGDHQITEGF